jgi:hypothetical protein
MVVEHYTGMQNHSPVPIKLRSIESSLSDAAPVQTLYNARHAPVAQLDRVHPSEGDTHQGNWSREQYSKSVTLRITHP